MNSNTVSFEEAAVPEKAWARESKYAQYETPASDAVKALAAVWDEEENRSAKSRRAILPSKADAEAMKGYLQSAANDLDPKRTARVRLTAVENGDGAYELLTWLVPFTSRGPGAKDKNGTDKPTAKPAK